MNDLYVLETSSQPDPRQPNTMVWGCGKTLHFFFVFFDFVILWWLLCALCAFFLVQMARWHKLTTISEPVPPSVTSSAFASRGAGSAKNAAQRPKVCACFFFVMSILCNFFSCFFCVPQTLGF